MTLSDLSASGTTNLHTASGGFTPAMVGNLIQLSGGPLSAGFYEITGYVGAQDVTLDRSAGSGSGTTGRVGGALATLNALAAAMIASNKAFVRGSGPAYSTTTTINFSASISPSPSNSVPPSRVLGYSTSRGDGGMFSLKLSAGGANGTDPSPITALNFSGTGWILDGASIDCVGMAMSSGVVLAGQFSDCRRCKVANFAQYGIAATVGDSAISDCQVTGGLSGCTAIYTNSANVKILRNHVHDNAGVGIVATYDDAVAWNVVVNNSGSSSDGVRIGYGTVAMFNTIHNSGRHGINKVDSNLINGQVRNNLMSQNGGYGYVGGGASGLPADPRYDGNAYYNNAWGGRFNCDDTSGVNGVAPYANVLDVILTASPFTNPSAGDWSLNNAFGGGASCRALGTPGPIPGLSTGGFADMGALQHQDGSSSSKAGFLEG